MQVGVGAVQRKTKDGNLNTGPPLRSFIQRTTHAGNPLIPLDGFKSPRRCAFDGCGRPAYVNDRGVAGKYCSLLHKKYVTPLCPPIRRNSQLNIQQNWRRKMFVCSAADRSSKLAISAAKLVQHWPVNKLRAFFPFHHLMTRSKMVRLCRSSIFWR